MKLSSEIKEAYKIACNDLKECYSEHGIYAGKIHFNEYWARDSFFASLGLIKIKEFNIVKKNLLFFLKYMKPNGQLPLRVTNYIFLLDYLKFIGINIKGKLRGIYKEDKTFNLPQDPNPLFLITALEYIKASKDKNFAEKYFNDFKRIMEWSFSNDKDNDLLIEENYYCGWADCLRKSGKVLYTNVCFYKALISLAEISKMLNKKEKAKDYLEIANKVKDQINKIFWNKNYYIDWVDTKKHNYFSTDGNVLAILWGVANKNQAKLIQNSIKKFQINDVPSKTNYPKYSSNEISGIIKLFGMGDYHNGLRWLWLGCIDVVAKFKLGMKKESSDLLNKISKMILKYGKVYEVYEADGSPVNRTFYKSEAPFAWSSALFIYAYHTLK